LSILEQQLDKETDPDRRGRLRRLLEAAQGVGTDLLAKAMAEYAAKASGIG